MKIDTSTIIRCSICSISKATTHQQIAKATNEQVRFHSSQRPQHAIYTKQELDSSLEEASALRAGFTEAENRFNDAAGAAEATREELLSEQKKVFVEREEELQRRVRELQEVRIVVVVVAAAVSAAVAGDIPLQFIVALVLLVVALLLELPHDSAVSLCCCLSRIDQSRLQEAVAAATEHEAVLAGEKAAGLQNLQLEKVMARRDEKPALETSTIVDANKEQ